MKTCSVDGCGRLHIARGYCMTHWTRLRKQGDVQADLPIRSKKRQMVCSIEGCGLPHYCKAMCRSHHGRWLRTGTPHKRAPMVCSVDGCWRPYKSRGWCEAHLSRWRRTGDPGGPLPTERTVTYNSAHRRIYRARGDADEFSCLHCGVSAQQWAYDHADPNAITDQGPVFSLEPSHYIPLCRSCHKRFDKKPGALAAHTAEAHP